jgi:hypothetical protein
MKAPGPIDRVGSLAGSLLGVARRRRESRKPRVRVRLAHGETRVLMEDAPERERLLALASDLVGEYGKGGRGTSP